MGSLYVAIGEHDRSRAHSVGTVSKEWILETSGFIQAIAKLWICQQLQKKT